jgi:hypothetical protein
MSTAGPLNDQPKKTLADLARRRGIRGWESMDKGALVKALSRPAPSAAKVAKKTTKAKPKGRPSIRVAAKPTHKPHPKANPKPHQKTNPKANGKSHGKPSEKAKPKPHVQHVQTAVRPGIKTDKTAKIVKTTKNDTVVKPLGKPAEKVAQPTAAPTPLPSPKAPTPLGKAPTPLAKAPTQFGKAPTPLGKAPTPLTNGTSSPKTNAKPTPATAAKPAVVVNAVKPGVKAPTKPGASAANNKSPGKTEAANAAAKDKDKDKEIAPRLPILPQAKDRLILAVNDPYWLHVMWELAPQSVQRAEAALKQDWYGAKLIIRLADVTSQDTTSTSETPIRDIPIEGDGRNWYINVPQPPRQYRADIGYLSRRGDFFPIARSNVVTPPKAGSSEALDVGWEKDPKEARRIVALSGGLESSAGSPEVKAFYEEKHGLRIKNPREASFGTGAILPGNLKPFFFEIDAKLLVQVRTDPTAHVTLGNDPITLKPDGTYVMQFSLPDSRQIIPAVATSADGVEERTIVLAVERNTKYLDPMIHDQMNEV